jgi:3-phenylpropionate/trans-cinnamate dioxygenase ferredoxin reductase component
MSAIPTFAIVGAGLAGAKAAETLRTEGFEGRLLLLGEETERPYDRPPLSKAYLRGETDRDAIYVHEEGFYAAHDIELRTSTPVRSIDPAGRQLALASGEHIDYERLLLATGAAPRRLRPGRTLPASTTCAATVTPTGWLPPPPGPSMSRWWGPAGLVVRPPPPSASSAGR